MCAADLGGARVAVHSVRREYPGRIVAVADVSLTLEPGEFVAITGPSGSGKTSLLSLIGALDRPTSGYVDVDGVRVSEPGADLAVYHRETVGFVFQHHNLLAHVSARANAEIPLIGAGMRRRERHERAARLLVEAGVGHRIDALASTLSSGERQRVAVARALANNPRLLLADEPTGALDTDAAEEVLNLIEQTRQPRGMTVLVVTHDPLVAGRADRILHMLDGRISSDGARLRPQQLDA